MAQIRVKDLTFCYDGGIDNIFEDVSFSIDTDWRLGFIGRNGKGKTTFLNLLLGKYRYQGTIDAPSGLRYFPYLVTERQMGMEAWEFIDELEEGCELWQAARELADLGETDEILYRPFGSLSPGERTKLLLAVLFAGNGGFFSLTSPPAIWTWRPGKRYRRTWRQKRALSWCPTTGSFWTPVRITAWC